LAWINEEDMKAIRSQADIVDIIGKYIAVEKSGRGFKAQCPFHDDHDPSMSISEEKQIFKCFVCGAGGNVFSFVQKFENITFPEAVYKVAQMINYPLELPGIQVREKPDPFAKERKILEEYTGYMAYELFSEEGAQAYSQLRERKFDDELIRKFQIGFAPSAGQSEHFFSAKHFAPDDLVNAGVLNDGRAVFVDRIMIPIHDPKGRLVGYTARRTAESEYIPKYINTASTPLYEKGKLIFNYHRAKDAARKSGRAILCEGAMDVLGLEKADLHEGIACLGTAFTGDQLQLIERLKVPVHVWYDNDRAGKKAAYTFGKAAMGRGIPFSIVSNDGAKDPDEVFGQFGAQEVRRIADHTISFVEFLFQYLPDQYNLDNYEDKKAFAQEMNHAIVNTADEFERAGYFSRLKDLTGFDFSSVNASPVQERINKREPRRPAYIPKVQDGRQKAEWIILSSILYSKQFSLRFKEEIGFFKDELYRQLSLYIYDLYRLKDSIDADELFAHIEEEDVRNLLASLVSSNEEPGEELFEDSLWKIKECTISEQIDKINEQIRILRDPVQKVTLAKTKSVLIEERNKIRNRKEG
jgi:DNA primase